MTVWIKETPIRRRPGAPIRVGGEVRGDEGSRVLEQRPTPLVPLRTESPDIRMIEVPERLGRIEIGTHVPRVGPTYVGMKPHKTKKRQDPIRIRWEKTTTGGVFPGAKQIGLMLNGRASLITTLSRVARLNANLAGSSSINVNVTGVLKLVAALAGAGVIEASAAALKRLTAEVSGAGSTDVRVNRAVKELNTVSLEGAASLGAFVSKIQNITHEFSGDAELSTLFSGIKKLETALSGATELTFLAGKLNMIAAGIAGRGDLNQIVSRIALISSELAATGVLTGAITRNTFKIIMTNLSGAGNLSEAMDRIASTIQYVGVGSTGAQFPLVTGAYGLNSAHPGYPSQIQENDLMIMLGSMRGFSTAYVATNLLTLPTGWTFGQTSANLLFYRQFWAWKWATGVATALPAVSVILPTLYNVTDASASTNLVCVIAGFRNVHKSVPFEYQCTYGAYRSATFGTFTVTRPSPAAPTSNNGYDLIVCGKTYSTTPADWPSGAFYINPASSPSAANAPQAVKPSWVWLHKWATHFSAAGGVNYGVAMGMVGRAYKLSTKPSALDIIIETQPTGAPDPWGSGKFQTGVWIRLNAAAVT